LPPSICIVASSLSSSRWVRVMSRTSVLVVGMGLCAAGFAILALAGVGGLPVIVTGSIVWGRPRKQRRSAPSSDANSKVRKDEARAVVSKHDVLSTERAAVEAEQRAKTAKQALKKAKKESKQASKTARKAWKAAKAAHKAFKKTAARAKKARAGEKRQKVDDRKAAPATAAATKNAGSKGTSSKNARTTAKATPRKADAVRTSASARRGSWRHVASKTARKTPKRPRQTLSAPPPEPMEIEPDTFVLGQADLPETH